MMRKSLQIVKRVIIPKKALMPGRRMYALVLLMLMFVLASAILSASNSARKWATLGKSAR
jgi:hypothetical protein